MALFFCVLDQRESGQTFCRLFALEAKVKESLQKEFESNESSEKENFELETEIERFESGFGRHHTNSIELESQSPANLQKMVQSLESKLWRLKLAKLEKESSDL